MILHASKTVRCWNEVVPLLRQGHYPPPLSEQAGGYWSLQEKGFLLAGLHGEWNGERRTAHRRHHKTPSQKVEGCRTVRDLRFSRKAHSSQGPQPVKQHSKQFAATLHPMPPPGTSQGCEMQALRCGWVNNPRLLHQALREIPQVGASLTHKAKSELRLGNSLGLIRASLGFSGSACSIVPQVAERIIAALIEAEEIE